MLFEKKKIQIETLSEYLTAVRKNLELSREQVSTKTGIKLKFLVDLESGDFKFLPADVYVLGFLRQLSQLYAVESQELIEQYKKEKGIQKQILKQSGHNRSWYKNIFGNLVVTPKVLSFVLGLLFIALTLGYIIWQVWSINKAPSLEIFEPSNNSVVKGAFVNIRGRTDPGMAVTVNDQTIFVDSSGNFKTQLGLSPGPEEISVVAKNRFDKAVTQVLSVNGIPDAVIAGGQVQLKIDFTGPVALVFTIDDTTAQTINFNAGGSKILTAKQKILLTTSDAGATRITLNGQSLGPMGKPKEVLTNVSFGPPADTGSVAK